jgi:hypothetical protein
MDSVKEMEPPFCGNPQCALHVRAGDQGVRGAGNWAVLADGRIIGRVLCGGIYMCDTCAREWIAVAVFDSDPQERGRFYATPGFKN